MALEFNTDFKRLTLGKINKIQMVIHIMDENLLQKENSLARTLTFNFLVQIDSDQNPVSQNKGPNKTNNLKSTIQTLQSNVDKLKTGIKNPVIDGNLNKLMNQSIPVPIKDSTKYAEEIKENLAEYNASVQQSANVIVETLESLKQAVNKLNSNLPVSTSQEDNYLYIIDRYLLLNVLKEHFIDKMGTLLPENIILTKISLIASIIEGTISADTNCLNITKETKIWEDTHILNQIGTHKGSYYYAKGFLLVQVKTSHSENLDKLIYFPNPALSKEIAENTPNRAQFVVIKSTGPTMSSLKFLITDYKNLNLSDDQNVSWTITPIFPINNSFVKGVQAEFIKYVQRGNVAPSIERVDYKKVIKDALDLQKQALDKQENEDEN